MVNESKNESRSLCYLTSCTYCCGLNTGKNTKEELTSILTNRTTLYKDIVKSKEDVPIYMDLVAKNETWQFMPKTKEELEKSNLGDLVRCRLLGFLDDTNKKVGCMAYPKNNNDEGIRAVYTDIHVASEMSGGYGADLNICKNHQCQASTMYKQLPKNLKNIVEIFTQNFDWYDISLNHKSSQKSTPLVKLTTLSYFDYVLDRLEKKEFSKDKVAVTKVINDIGIIAREIVNLNDNWIYKETKERRIESNKYCMEGLPSGIYWTNSLKNKLSDWKRKKESNSEYKITITRDKNIALGLEALNKDFKKEEIVFIQNGKVKSEYLETYFVNGLKTRDWNDITYLKEKGLVTKEESRFDWDEFRRQYAVHNFRFNEDSIFDRRYVRDEFKKNTKQNRLEKIFYRLDSFFVSRKEMNKATRKINEIIDTSINIILANEK
jgi:hypothetical protein